MRYNIVLILLDFFPPFVEFKTFFLLSSSQNNEISLEKNNILMLKMKIRKEMKRNEVDVRSQIQSEISNGPFDQLVSGKKVDWIFFSSCKMQ